MPATAVDYVAGGNTSAFAIPFQYLDASHVRVAVNGVAASFTIQTGAAVLAAQPLGGSVVRVSRRTPSDPLVEFRLGNLDPQDLNVADIQSLYRAEEAVDLANEAHDLAVAETANRIAVLASLSSALRTEINAITASDVIKAYSAARSIVEFINVRDPAFAGGARADGIWDDAPAIRAALAYAKTVGTRYKGGSVKIKLPHGVLKLASTDPVRADRYLDMTGCNNILIEGEGEGATTIFPSGNAAVFRGSDPASNPLFAFGLRDFRIYGAGNALSDADGIDFAANNNCEVRSVRIYGCRRAVAWSNAFHTRLIDVNVNATGELACYDGFYAKDGEPGVVENSVLIIGCQVQGCVRWGWRGESITGTKVFGLEILGCGGTGVYFGESPSGKDLKWFTWVGGLIDTCRDLLVIKKGASSVATLLHFSGMWMGYAFDPSPGVGIAVEMIGLNDCNFSADIIANVEHAANIQNCNRIYFGAKTIQDYDNQAVGGTAIICNSTRNSRFDIGTTKAVFNSPVQYAFVEQGTSNNNLVSGVFDKGVALLTQAQTGVVQRSRKDMCIENAA